MMQVESATKSWMRDKVTRITHPPGSIILSVILTIMLKRLLEWIWPSLAAPWNPLWLTTTGTLIVSAIGVALFQLKERNQILYGKIEFGLAVLFIGISLHQVQTVGDAGSSIAVVTGAYLIVRGLTNWKEGKGQSSRKEEVR